MNYFDKGINWRLIPGYAKGFKVNNDNQSTGSLAIIDTENSKAVSAKTEATGESLLPEIIQLKIRLQGSKTALPDNNAQFKIGEEEYKTAVCKFYDPEAAEDEDLSENGQHSALLFVYSDSGKYMAQNQEYDFVEKQINTEYQIQLENDKIVHTHNFRHYTEDINEIKHYNKFRNLVSENNDQTGKIFYYPYGGFFKPGASLENINQIYAHIAVGYRQVVISLVPAEKFIEEGVLFSQESDFNGTIAVFKCQFTETANHSALQLIKDGKVTIRLKSSDQKKETVFSSYDCDVIDSQAQEYFVKFKNS